MGHYVSSSPSSPWPTQMLEYILNNSFFQRKTSCLLVRVSKQLTNEGRRLLHTKNYHNRFVVLSLGISSTTTTTVFLNITANTEYGINMSVRLAG